MGFQQRAACGAQRTRVVSSLGRQIPQAPTEQTASGLQDIGKVCDCHPLKYAIARVSTFLPALRRGERRDEKSAGIGDVVEAFAAVASSEGDEETFDQTLTRSTKG